MSACRRLETAGSNDTQVAGHPVSLFLQYQHTWYDTATFNTPMPASPFFNYAFKRDGDMLKFGVIVHQ